MSERTNVDQKITEFLRSDNEFIKLEREDIIKLAHKRQRDSDLLQAMELRGDEFKELLVEALRVGGGELVMNSDGEEKKHHYIGETG